MKKEKKKTNRGDVESQKGAIDKFVLKRVEEPSKRLSVDNLEQSNENLNDENHINEDSINLNDHDNVTNHINEDNTYLNEHDNVPNASNICCIWDLRHCRASTASMNLQPAKNKQGVRRWFAGPPLRWQSQF